MPLKGVAYSVKYNYKWYYFGSDFMKKLTKSSTDKALFGVCGGIAEFFGISSFIVRLIFFCTSPASFWVYIILVLALKSNHHYDK